MSAEWGPAFSSRAESSCPSCGATLRITRNLECVHCGTSVLLAASFLDSQLEQCDTPGKNSQALVDQMDQKTTQPNVRLTCKTAGSSQTITATASSFGTHVAEYANGIIAQLVCVDPADAASDLNNTEELRGKIGLIRRGGCSFVEKMRRLQAAGAIACICIQTQSVWPFTMSDTALVGNDISLPSVMVRAEDGDRLRAMIEENPAHTTVHAMVIDHQTSCSICLAEFIAGSTQVVKLPTCSHCFHEDCIRKWLKGHTSCPTCRAELPSAEQDSQFTGSSMSLMYT